MILKSEEWRNFNTLKREKPRLAWFLTKLNSFFDTFKTIIRRKAKEIREKDEWCDQIKPHELFEAQRRLKMTKEERKQEQAALERIELKNLKARNSKWKGVKYYQERKERREWNRFQRENPRMAWFLFNLDDLCSFLYWIIKTKPKLRGKNEREEEMDILSK